ncbi:MAG: penicillin acylase family protein [Rhodospirillales bacterium]
MKKLRRIAMGLIGLAVAGSAAVLIWISPLLHIGDGTLAVAGLTAPVEIVRDQYGTPFIKAQNDNDAYVALGFMHARDRFWQMEATRRLVAGRLAEIAGNGALESDKLMRVFGLARLAEAQYAHSSQSLRNALQAYADGVNAWLRTHRGALAPEFFVLRYEPEPWQPVHSLYWGKAMGMRLSLNWRREILRHRLAGKLSPEQLRDLWPPFGEDDPATIEGDKIEGGKQTGIGSLFRPSFAAMIESVLGPFSEASNAWAVSGRHTASGKPVLANDPHLEFGIPILWYLARIETPTLTLAGATIPGFPLHILGQNGDIAWGLTTMQGDAADLFIEKSDPADPARYLTPNGSEPIRVRRETIKVKGGPAVVLTVRETRHGPVVSDLQPHLIKDARTFVSMQATFLQPDDTTPDAAYRLNRAADWPSFLAALERFHSPQQNIMYADRRGNIGLAAAGRMPLRKNGRGWMPHEGWSGAYDWRGYIPFEELPQTFNPPSGMIVNANNRVAGADYPYFLSEDWAPGYRAKRIAALLTGGEKHDVAASARIQMDNLSLMAREILPLMLDGMKGIPTTGDPARALDLLKSWSGEMDGARPEPLIFNAWLRDLIRAVAADELGEDFPSYWYVRPRFICRVLTARREWCDDITTANRTESCADALRGALDRALRHLGERYGEDMSAWRWGEAHRIRFRHSLLGRIPVIGRFVNRTRESNGGHYTPNKGGYRYLSDADPFENRHGAGFRGIYDLADPDRSRFMIATGQSGNALSPLYDNFIDDWLSGAGMPLGASLGEIRTAPRGILRLLPESGEEKKS